MSNDELEVHFLTHEELCEELERDTSTESEEFFVEKTSKSDADKKTHHPSEKGEDAPIEGLVFAGMVKIGGQIVPLMHDRKGRRFVPKRMFDKWIHSNTLRSWMYKTGKRVAGIIKGEEIDVLRTICNQQKVPIPYIHLHARVVHFMLIEDARFFIEKAKVKAQVTAAEQKNKKPKTKKEKDTSISNHDEKIVDALRKMWHQSKAMERRLEELEKTVTHNTELLESGLEELEKSVTHNIELLKSGRKRKQPEQTSDCPF